MHNWYRTYRAAAVVVLTLITAGCGGGSSSAGVKATASVDRSPGFQAASIVLDWYPNSDHGGLYTAIKRGYLAQRHIALIPRVPSNTSAQIQLVASGRAGFGITYEADLLAARARGVPIQSVMCLMQHPLNTVMSLRKSHIERPRDLVGKRIGVAGSPSDTPTVDAMMRDDGVDPHTAKLVNVGYNLRPALLSGNVDAVIGVYWSWEAIQAAMAGEPVTTLRVENWGVPNYCELVLVASVSTIRRQPALVRGTVSALQAGYAYAEAHPVAAWNALHAADKTLDRKLVIRSLVLLRPAVTDARTVGYQSAAQWRRYAAWLRTQGLLTGNPHVSSAFTNTFLMRNIH